MTLLVTTDGFPMSTLCVNPNTFAIAKPKKVYSFNYGIAYQVTAHAIVQAAQTLPLEDYDERIQNLCIDNYTHRSEMFEFAFSDVLLRELQMHYDEYQSTHHSILPPPSKFTRTQSRDRLSFQSNGGLSSPKHKQQLSTVEADGSTEEDDLGLDEISAALGSFCPYDDSPAFVLSPIQSSPNSAQPQQSPPGFTALPAIALPPGFAHINITSGVVNPQTSSPAKQPAFQPNNNSPQPSRSPLPSGSPPPGFEHVTPRPFPSPNSVVLNTPPGLEKKRTQ